MAPIPVLINCSAGMLKEGDRESERIGQAFANAGVDVEVELVEGGKCEVRCQALADRGHELVVVGGGDGTVSAAASTLAGTKTALGILPLGTLNHFARDLGLPLKLEKAVDLIVRRPERRVDIGQMNERIFVNNSAIGLYPLMLIDRDLQRMKLGRTKRTAMIIASLKTLWRFGHQRLTLTINDEKARLDTPLLFVGNNHYRTDIAAPGRRERIDEGFLSVYVMRKKSRRGFIAASIRVLFNRARDDDMVRMENVKRLTVTSRRRSLAVSIDGEVVRAMPPLDYRIRKRALRVIAP